jgi:hypothetical protein
MYHLTGQKVAELLGLASERTLLAWLDERTIPTSEQAINLAYIYEQFRRVQEGEGPIAAMEWFESHDISQLVQRGKLQAVSDSATHYMMPQD